MIMDINISFFAENVIFFILFLLTWKSDGYLWCHRYKQEELEREQQNEAKYREMVSFFPLSLSLCQMCFKYDVSE